MAVLKKDFEEKQKQLDAKQQELEAMRADFEKQAAVLSEQVKQAKAAELDKRMGELRQLYVQLQQDLSAREQEGMKGLLDKMAAIVKEIADAEGFQIVLEKSDAGVVWAQPALDVTNELVRKYNARYPKGSQPDPKAAPKADAEPAAPAATGSGAPNPRQEALGGGKVTFALAELAARVGGEVSGDGSLRLSGVAPLETATLEQVSFFANRKYRKAFLSSRAGAVLLEPDEAVPAGRTVCGSRTPTWPSPR